MLEEDRPPVHIWLDEEELEKHFALMDERRKSAASSGMESVPAAGEEMPMTENEVTAALLRRK